MSEGEIAPESAEPIDDTPAGTHRKRPTGDNARNLRIMEALLDEFTIEVVTEENHSLLVSVLGDDLRLRSQIRVGSVILNAGDNILMRSSKREVEMLTPRYTLTFRRHDAKGLMRMPLLFSSVRAAQPGRPSIEETTRLMELYSRWGNSALKDADVKTMSLTDLARSCSESLRTVYTEERRMGMRYRHKRPREEIRTEFSTKSPPMAVQTAPAEPEPSEDHSAPQLTEEQRALIAEKRRLAKERAQAKRAKLTEVDTESAQSAGLVSEGNPRLITV
eukprot:CAMPEP_0204271738 /NCGR_PEP_ID=MMETSP0468-20130131/20956_1 /ASSEMBLY_ACC=CAM_ASM_000383 /TAXON_ID=2969 /ORGANISM="Oxyrrhis marina" /LENGTH=275 /DNA_ID=CAMNT_0051247489 /DNA_START=22 /DNA_END=849 /DNA_ORIENTATION=+